jgi:hypothetical protein
VPVLTIPGILSGVLTAPGDMSGVLTMSDGLVGVLIVLGVLSGVLTAPGEYSPYQMAYLGYSHCRILPFFVWEILTVSGSPLEVCMPETFPRTRNADTVH